MSDLDEYLAIATEIFERVLATPQVSREVRDWAFTLEVCHRGDLLGDARVAYPRTGAEVFFAALIDRDPARAVDLLRRHLGWVEGGAAPDGGGARLAMAWRELARGHAAAGHPAEAAIALRRAVTLDPTHLGLNLSRAAFEAVSATEARSASSLADRMQAAGSAGKPKGARRDAGGTRLPPDLAAFVTSWIEPPVATRVSSEILARHQAVAPLLERDVAAIDAELARRAAIGARLQASADAAVDETAVLDALRELAWPLDDADGERLVALALALVRQSPALGFAVAARACERKPAEALPILLRVASVTGRDADEFVAAARIFGGHGTALWLPLAGYLVRRGSADAAADALRDAKLRGDVELHRALEDDDLRPLTARPDVRAVFDEPVSTMLRGVQLVGEAVAVLVVWARPFAAVASHIGALLDRFLVLAGSALRFGNTSVRSAERRPYDPAMLGRARRALVGPASGRALVSFDLRDTAYGAYQHGFGCLGSQAPDERTVAWIVLPAAAAAGGAALFAEITALAALAGPCELLQADVAIVGDRLSPDPFDRALAMFTRLHPGLEVEPAELASTLHINRERDAIPGARWIVALGRAPLERLGPPPAMSAVVGSRAGELTVFRAGEQPTRGFLLEDPPWLTARRELARYLEPITALEAGSHKYVGGRAAWARRFLAS